MEAGLAVAEATGARRIVEDLGDDVLLFHGGKCRAARGDQAGQAPSPAGEYHSTNLPLNGTLRRVDNCPGVSSPPTTREHSHQDV